MKAEVGIAELKDTLSEYLRAVRKGGDPALRSFSTQGKHNGGYRR
jgi:hypothetical protein